MEGPDGSRVGIRRWRAVQVKQQGNTQTGSVQSAENWGEGGADDGGEPCEPWGAGWALRVGLRSGRGPGEAQWLPCRVGRWWWWLWGCGAVAAEWQGGFIPEPVREGGGVGR